VSRLVPLLLCGAGAILLAVGLRQAARGRETRGWTRTAGRVLESRVEASNAPDEQQGTRYGFVIRYAYEARGGRHVSEQVWIGSAAGSVSENEAWPRRWVERFPAGSEVPVFFDPADPRQAVLVQGVPASQTRVLVGVGSVLLAAGAFWLARLAGR
jgi:hypothetical protein